MTAPPPAVPPPAGKLRELRDAVAQLEQHSVASRLAMFTGTPVEMAVKYLPEPVSARLRGMIKSVLVRCFESAINSLDDEEFPVANPWPDPWTGRLMVGLAGGIGGFFGAITLPLELPLTTTFMLRGIAEIARAEGEDLRDPETRLACLEVFALGGGRRSQSDGVHLEYYAVRTVLTRLAQDLGRHTMERGALTASAPIIARMAGEIVSRFGLAISDRFASGIVPVVGALGGATVNMLFMDHFQRVARGHFTVRRLEREFGVEAIRHHYRLAVSETDGRHP